MGRRPRKLDPTASAAALFGAKVRKFREAKGWSQEQLGERVYCTGDMISKIELAQRPILASPVRSPSSASTKAPTSRTSKVRWAANWSKRPQRWKTAKRGFN